jgi:hypothetical protein
MGTLTQPGSLKIQVGVADGACVWVISGGFWVEVRVAVGIIVFVAVLIF